MQLDLLVDYSKQESCFNLKIDFSLQTLHRRTTPVPQSNASQTMQLGWNRWLKRGGQTYSIAKTSARDLARNSRKGTTSIIADSCPWRLDTRESKDYWSDSWTTDVIMQMQNYHDLYACCIN